MPESSWPWKHSLVVGASSGIGEALARQLAHGGSRVALVARRGDRLQALADDLNSLPDTAGVRSYTHDVRQTGEVAALFQQIVTELGGLDLVVYAAGIMPRVGMHEYPTALDIATIETNLGGAVAWLNEAAARFERARNGTIVGISSVAGDRGRRPSPIYGATKAALDAYLESLRGRLAAGNTTVLTAKPGYVRTQMIEGRALPPLVPVPSPEYVAHRILEAAAAKRRVVYIPPWWRWIMLGVRLIPARIFEHVKF